MTNKKFGRVGDSPMIGAGTYANNETCAISCTGSGEFFYMCMCVCLLFPFILYFSQLNIIFTFVVARQDTYNGWNSNNGCRGYLLDTEQQQ